LIAVKSFLGHFRREAPSPRLGKSTEPCVKTSEQATSRVLQRGQGRLLREKAEVTNPRRASWDCLSGRRRIRKCRPYTHHPYAR
jgi:hypothetical protein